MVAVESNESFPGLIQVDLEAVQHNLALLRDRASGAQVMAVVKADAYGHGRLPVALAALRAGVDYFGVSQIAEAIQLRRQLDSAGISPDAARIFSWLTGPGQDWELALNADIELSASSVDILDRIAAAALRLGKTAPVHLKVDVGMSRGGATIFDLPQLAERARVLQQQGAVSVVGIWSHLPAADDLSETGEARINRQVDLFNRAVTIAEAAGLRPRLRHLAATSGTLWYPQTHLDLVRVGIGMYGLSPDAGVAGSEELGLRPALSLGAPLTLVKQISAGTSVSYGGTWTAETDHWIGLVPLGYADGIPRHASNAGPVTVGGRYRTQILGRVCMDQFVVDLGTGATPQAAEGDWVTLIGSGALDPTADDWAEVSGTINYEVVTRLAATIPRDYGKGNLEP